MSKLRQTILNKNVVLIGHMGSGKSSIGKSLAKKLHLKFIDSDEEIEVIAGMKISKIFELKGEEYFRLLEKKTIMKILNNENSIIAIGGGAFEHASLRNYILKKCSCIWLKCNINVLVNRCSLKMNRPLLKGKNIRQELISLDKVRRNNYARAHYSLNVSNKKKFQIVKHLSDIIKDYD